MYYQPLCGRIEEIFSLAEHLENLWEPPILLLKGYQGLFSQNKVFRA